MLPSDSRVDADKVTPSIRLLLFVVFALYSASAPGEETGPNLPTASANSDEHSSVDKKQLPIAKMLSQYCYDCHGTDVHEANVRLDSIDLNEKSIPVGETLDKVLTVVTGEKMPPEDAEQPSPEERAQLVSWIESRLDELAKQLPPAAGRSRNRRLTVEEYNYTMQSLFSVDAEFADMLPPDPISSSGYRTNNARLGLSSIQIEAYLDSARRAINRYVQFGEFQETPLAYHIEFENLHYATGDRYGTRKQAPHPIDMQAFSSLREANRTSPPRYVEPLGPKLPGAYTELESMRAAIPKLNEQFVALRQRLAVGEMVVRVRAAATQDRKGRFPRMRVEAGITLGDGCSIDKRLLGEVDVTASRDEPAAFEFRMRLEDIPTKGALDENKAFDRLSVFDLDQLFISNATSDDLAVFALGRGGYSDPKKGSRRIAKHIEKMASGGVSLLYLDCVEIEMVPGVGVDNDSYRWQIPRVEESEAAAERFIRQFMRAAYRRPVIESEVATKCRLFRKLRDQGYSFDDSLREALAAVLVSPSFLFRESSVGQRGSSRLEITPHRLAARLSYLLWLSPPDEELMQLANDGTIDSPKVLRRQATRLIADPRSRRFTESFCCQWLRLDRLANVAVDREHHSTYDEDLAADSLSETLAYFHEVFTGNVSALDLIDSDYAMLSDRLAQHYNLPTLTKGGMNRVRLPDDSVRGGLLTQASLLTMNSDGVDSHPIRRGVWLLDRLLNDPPPPPPPNVPELEDGGSTAQDLTLKARIALHREPNACQACHEKIDPWGIVFENYNAVGMWRDTTTQHDNAEAHSSPVDSKTTLPDGSRINNIAEFKLYLRQHQRERFAEAVVHHMLTYALGRRPDFRDRPFVDEIRQRFVESDYRLQEILLALVESPLFREP